MISVNEEDSNAKSSSLGQDLCFIANLVCSKTFIQNSKILEFENSSCDNQPSSGAKLVERIWDVESFSREPSCKVSAAHGLKVKPV